MACWALCSITAKHLQNLRSKVASSKVAYLSHATLFGLLFAMLFRHAFKGAASGVYLRSRFDGKLFNISRLKAKSKDKSSPYQRHVFFWWCCTCWSLRRTASMRDEPLIQSMRYLFSLTITLKKAQVTCQETAIPPAISVKDNQLEVVNQFTYLGPTTTDNLSLEVELGIIYIYGQERKLYVFYLRCMRQVLRVSWQDKVTYNEVIGSAGIHLYTPYSASAAYDGFDAYIGWSMTVFQKTCCMVNWPQGTETKVVPTFVTKTSTSGIWRP